MTLVARSDLLSLSSSFTAAAARSGRPSISFRFAVSNAFAPPKERARRWLLQDC